MKKMFLVLSVILGLSFAAKASFTADQSQQGAITPADVIANISQNVILKTYQDMARTSIELKSAIDRFEVNPTQANLEIAQAAWRTVRGAYEVSEGFLFGPMDALSIDPLIDTWPLNLKDLRLILASNQDLNVDFVRSLGSDLQGFHAIEFLLFGEGVVSNTKEVSQFNTRQIQYLASAASLLVEQTDRLMSAWTTHFDPEDPTTPAYIDVLSKPGSSNPFYTTEDAVIQEFVNGMISIVTEAGDGKLPDAAGKDIENANASLEESPFSWNSITDFTSNINSVLNIYNGTYGGHTGAGIRDLVALRDPVLADKVQAQMINCRALIQAVAGPTNMSFGKAIRDPAGRVRIFNAIKALVELRHSLEQEVVPATTPSVTLN